MFFALLLPIIRAQGQSDIELAAPPPETEKPEKSDPAEFIRYECGKTEINIFIPKWTVGGAKSSPDLGKVFRLFQFGPLFCLGIFHREFHIVISIVATYSSNYSRNSE